MLEKTSTQFLNVNKASEVQTFMLILQ